MVLVDGFTAMPFGLTTGMVAVTTRSALLVAFAIIVCGPEDSRPVANDHDVVPVASENTPPSIDTSTFWIPVGSDAVPVTVIEPASKIALLEGDVIVTTGDAAKAASSGNENNIVATRMVIDKNENIPFIILFHLKF